MRMEAEPAEDQVRWVDRQILIYVVVEWIVNVERCVGVYSWL